MNIRVQLVDDHRVVREGLKALMSGAVGIEVVAEAVNGREGLAKVAQLRPDVVLMDINMPEMNGIEATQRITSESPSTRVLMLSTAQERVNVVAALRAGAKGYLSKDSGIEEILEAIRAVASGKTYFGAKITELLLNDVEPNDGSDPGCGLLSEREQEVLRLVSGGKNTKDIAFTLSVSVKTVETHRLHIMKKLNLFSIADLTKYAIRKGLTPLW